MRPHCMTIADTVKWSGIGRTKLYELLGDKKIQAVKLGTRTLVLTQSVEQFLASLPRLEDA
jgi:excisionase family DNA binding protein